MYQNNNKAEQLFLKNIRLVHFVAKKYIGKINHNDLEEVYSEGAIGLLLAARNFKEEYGNKFSTYAVPHIKGRIGRYFRDSGQSVHSIMRLPRKVQARRRLFDEYIANHSKIRKNEVLEELRLTEEEYAIFYEYASTFHEKPIRLNAPLKNNGNIYSCDIIGATEFPFDNLYTADTIKTILKLLKRNVLKRIFIERFVNVRTQSEIANITGFSQAQVSRLINKITAICEENKQLII